MSRQVSITELLLLGTSANSCIQWHGRSIFPSGLSSKAGEGTRVQCEGRGCSVMPRLGVSEQGDCVHSECDECAKRQIAGELLELCWGLQALVLTLETSKQTRLNCFFLPLQRG